MTISVFDLFTVGVGPSSSHTVGPMRAAKRFVNGLAGSARLPQVHRLKVELFGSLALTGKGHGTDKAVLLGLEGEEPETVDPAAIGERVEGIRERLEVSLLGRHPTEFDESRHLLFHKRRSLPHHPNGMRFTAFDESDEVLAEKTYYSIGGGFVVNEDAASEDQIVPDTTVVAHPFASGEELLAICEESGLAIWQVMLANEKSWRREPEVRSGLRAIGRAMHDCVEAGCRNEGILPGGLEVARRAPKLHRELAGRSPEALRDDPLAILDWISMFAIAVSEENAAGGRVVTAPTNGAAGILPAVLEYYLRFVRPDDEEAVERFLLTAAAIGILFKENASISGAEVGCQGEVGVACSMAAAGLAELLGGTPCQVENAAEIGMEHNLGLTCDPIGGFVQIPCIERNAMGAVKAINAARLARRGDGGHKVSLDEVIETMRDTGADMKTKYKETSRGGLALNVIEC
ncbi:MAG: L-serine ammonia-lyase [Acidobacteriota bacterium]|nr:L-serine ammonia-lyase [Acidobacteriota bacterium]MDH3523844.1 L-serine ammonia-lyase [Acidobacteriota bacterium]